MLMAERVSNLCSLYRACFCRYILHTNKRCRLFFVSKVNGQFENVFLKRKKDNFRLPNNIIRHNYIFAMFGFTDLESNFVCFQLKRFALSRGNNPLILSTFTNSTQGLSDAKTVAIEIQFHR